MKVKDIEIGGVYSNDKGRHRKVINIFQDNTICGGGRMVVQYKNMSADSNCSLQLFLDSFAKWAKEKL